MKTRVNIFSASTKTGTSSFSGRNSLSHSARAVRAMTILEISIASALGVTVLAVVLAAFTANDRSFRAVSNYGQIHKQGRMAVDLFARDLRKAINLTNYGTTSLTMVVPTGFNSTGSVTGTESIRYSLIGTTFVRQNLTTGQTSTLANSVYSTTFTMYNRIGSITASTLTCKGVQLEIKLKKHVVGVFQTEDFLSARLMMRNKP